MGREIRTSDETLIFAGTGHYASELDDITAVLVCWERNRREFISPNSPQKRLTRLRETEDHINLLISYKDEQGHDNAILAPLDRLFVFRRIPGTGQYPVPKYIDPNQNNKLT